MSSFPFCDTTCGTLEFPESYEPIAEEGQPCPEPEKVECCIPNIGFVLCDEDSLPATITDPEDIDDLKAANKLVTFNLADVTFNTPTEITEAGPCGMLIPVRKEQLIDVKIWLVSSTHADEVFWNKMCRLNGKFGVIFQYKDGYTILNQNIIQWYLDGAEGDMPSEQLGVPVSFSISPYREPFNRDAACKWIFQLKIDYECNFISALLPGFQGAF